MNDQPVNIVWLKRDIRIQDHAPLRAAEQAGLPYYIIYLFDPNLIQHPDTSIRHLQFIYHSILDLNSALSRYGREVHLFYGKSAAIFEHLVKKTNIHQIFSYQETGVKATWERDKEVQNILKAKRITWTEFQRDGILRGIRDRKGWDKNWYVTMSSPPIANTYSTNTCKLPEHPFQIPIGFRKSLTPYPAHFQPAGETNAWKYLASFAGSRGKKYHLLISKPEASRTSCSRIST